MNDHKTFHEASLLLDINKHLSLRLSHHYNWNERPPPGVKKRDSSLLQSLVMKF